MKVGVFFNKDHRVQAEQMLSQLSSLRMIETHGFEVTKNWQQLDGNELQFHFNQFDLFVIITNGPLQYDELEKPELSWLYFITGYCMGREKPFCQFVLHPNKVHGLSTAITQVYEDSVLLSYVRDEYAIWIHHQQVTEAKDRIISSGLGLKEDSMAKQVVLGNMSVVKDFLTIGFSPDATDVQGTPLIILALRNGKESMFSLLLTSGSNLDAKSEDRGSTALMEAALKGSSDLVRLLIDKGVDLDTQSKNGQTALMLAVGEAQTMVALQLIYAGADVTIKDQLGMTAEKYASLFGHTQIVDAITKTLQSIS
jgi:ankyrin repeat protein